MLGGIQGKLVFTNHRFKIRHGVAAPAADDPPGFVRVAVESSHDFEVFTQLFWPVLGNKREPCRATEFLSGSVDKRSVARLSVQKFSFLTLTC